MNDLLNGDRQFADAVKAVVKEAKNKPVDSPLVVRLKEMKAEILTAMAEVRATDRTSRALAGTRSGACWTSAAKSRDAAVKLLKAKLKIFSEEL